MYMDKMCDSLKECSSGTSNSSLYSLKLNTWFVTVNIRIIQARSTFGNEAQIVLYNTFSFLDNFVIELQKV